MSGPPIPDRQTDIKKVPSCQGRDLHPAVPPCLPDHSPKRTPTTAHGRNEANVRAQNSRVSSRIQAECSRASSRMAGRRLTPSPALSRPPLSVLLPISAISPLRIAAFLEQGQRIPIPDNCSELRGRTPVERPHTAVLKYDSRSSATLPTNRSPEV